MSAMDDIYSAAQAVDQGSNSSQGAVPLVMLYGAGLESSFDPSAAGGGAWQITDNVSFTPTDLNSAAQYMYPRYYQAWQAAGSPTPGDITPDIAAQIAYQAERPAEPYTQSQPQNVQSDFTDVINYLKGLGIQFGSGGAESANNSAPVDTSVLGVNVTKVGQSVTSAAQSAAAVFDALLWLMKPSNDIRLLLGLLSLIFLGASVILLSREVKSSG